MDEELLKAARVYFDQLAKARAAGDKPSATERENYARQLTGGTHGYADMEALRDSLHDDTMGAAAQNVLQGMTGNFGDELIGLLGGSAAKEGARLRGDLLHQERPVTTALGELGGGAISAAMLPVGKFAEGASLAQKMRAGAKVGAVLGAANGVGAGEDMQSRALGGVAGGVGGAVLGAAVPGVMGSRVGSYVGNKIAGATGAVMTPLEESFARLHGVRAQLEKAVESLGGFQAAHAANDALEAGGRGDIATFADLGRPMTGLADYAATNSSKAANEIGDLAETRAGSSTSRVRADFTAAAGEHSADARVAQLAAETRAWANGPDAYGTRANGLGLHGANPTVDLNEAAPLVEQPKIKSLYNNAKQTSQIGPGATDFAAQAMKEARASNPELDKFMSANPKLNITNLVNDPDAVAQLEMMGKGHLIAALKSADGKAPFEVVQDLQQSLDDAAEHAFANKKNNLGFRLKDSADLVQRTLEEQIPGYGDIVDQYAARKGMARAVEQGQDWFNKKADMIGLKRVVDSFKDKPLLLEEFRKGLASEQLIALQRQTGENAATKMLIAKNNLPQQQMNEIVFGDQPTYNRFMQQAKAERQLGYLSSAGKGSQTMPRAAARESAEGVVGDVRSELRRGHFSFLRAGLHKADRALFGAYHERRADELTPFLLTQGHKSIDELLNILEQSSARARVGVGSTRYTPSAAASLFGDARSQD